MGVDIFLRDQYRFKSFTPRTLFYEAIRRKKTIAVGCFGFFRNLVILVVTHIFGGARMSLGEAEGPLSSGFFFEVYNSRDPATVSGLFLLQGACV